MTVALISENGVRLIDVPVIQDEILVPVLLPMAMFWPADARLEASQLPTPVYEYRRFVRQDDLTYLEKD